MLKTLVKRSKENKGFSLIELIVVIAIIAILALILVPRFSGFTDEAREGADAATARTIETAVVALMSNGTFSIETTGTDGVIVIETGTTVDSVTGLDVTDADGDGASDDAEDDAQYALRHLLGSDVHRSDGGDFTVTIDGNTLDVSVSVTS